MEIMCGKKGCEWVGELRNKTSHEEICQYVSKKCENECSEVVMRKDMEYHVHYKCPRRRVCCKHCDLNLEFSELQDHHKICKMYPVECVYDCGEVLRRCQMEGHTGRQGMCPNTPVNCDFRSSGCEFQGKRSDLLEHMESNVVSHLNLLAKKLSTTTEELEKTNQELKVTKQRLAEAESTLADMESQHYEELTRRGLSMPSKKPKKYIYIWRIDNWAKEVLAAKCDQKSIKDSIGSDGFYVYPGYRLYLRALPNNVTDIDTAISYLGVFLVATEGKHDKNVVWPFPFSFDLEVVDQQPNGNNIFYHMSPPYGSALKHSTSDCGCGTPYLASHDILGTRCYIKDDAILIRLTIHLI